MAQKNISARIKNKRDTSANWDKNNPVILNGEIIIVDMPNGDVRYKTGDGVKNYKQIPFNDEAIKAQIDNKLTKPDGNKGQLLGFIENNVVGAVNAPEPNTGNFNEVYVGTLSTSWTAEGTQFYQQVSIAGMGDSVCPLVFPQWGALTGTTRTNQEAAWNLLTGIQSFNGYARFYASARTTTAVPYKMYYTTAENRVVALNNNLGGLM